MYKLPDFTETDQERVITFMKENPFAVITGIGAQYPVATHIPLLMEVTEEGKILLQGHMMKHTDHHKAMVKNDNVLVIFNGPHTYVSASWYENPQVGSTWNYITVHAKGKIIFTDAEGTYNAVKAITNKYEGEASVAAFHQLPDEYVTKLVSAIVGFTIEVESFDNVFKLSQNHTAATKYNITQHLQQRGDDQSAAIAEEMKK